MSAIQTSDASPAGDPGARHCGCHPAHWFVVQAEPGKDNRAYSEIAAAGFRVYQAWFVQYANAKDLLGTRRKLFPGYLFTSFCPDLAPTWPEIFRLPGVKRLFCIAYGKPAPIPPGFVEGLQARGRAGDGAIDERAKAFPALPEIEPGTAVRVLDGPFSSFTGILQMSDRDRVEALLEIFGRNTSVRLPRASVEPI